MEKGVSMASQLQIRKITGANSERFPMLIDDATGMPLFYPTVYQTSIIRGKGDQEATMEANLRAIKFLYNWSEKTNIDIDARFKNGDFLRMHEVESLAADVRTRADKLFKDLFPEKQSKSKVTNLDQYRKSSKVKTIETVSGGTAGNRFRYIRDYLDWLASQMVSRIDRSSAKYVPLSYALGEMKKAFNARIPAQDQRHELFRKLGLTLDDQEKLLAVVDVDSPENPWKDARVRYRNQLFINLLVSTGIRKGEALSIKVEDLNLQENLLTIHRTPDDPLDPRTHQPQTKTNARTLPLNKDLARMCSEYINYYRSKNLPSARKDYFLFVGTKNGKALSISAANDIFKDILVKNPGIQKNLSAHILRHTWNDRFSELSDDKIKKGDWTIEDERKARCALMGWVLDSEMAWYYSRRHIIAKAREVGLSLQESIFGKKDE